MSPQRSDVVVFLGPTLPLDEARRRLDARYLPPVKMGDVFAAVQRHAPKVICVIDGFFERVPAVWHKELLYALTQGVRVVGASSMGALRAAELHAFGVEGVGAVFEAYRSGVIEDDDEVTLMHGPEESGYRAMSEPLVNIRVALDTARSQGLIGASTAQQLVELARARFYAEGCWARIFAEAGGGAVDPGEIERLQTFVSRTKPNAKRDDALAALDVAGADKPAPAVTFDFEPSLFWQRLVSTTEAAGVPGAPSDEAVVRFAQLGLADFTTVSRPALLMRLLEAEAARLGVSVSGDELEQGLETLRRERGLLDSQRFNDWLAAQAIDDDDLLRLVRGEVLLQKISAIHRARTVDEGGWLLELKRQGLYGPAREALGARPPSDVMPAAPADDAELLRWYGPGRLVLELEAWARRVGFETGREFLVELLHAHRTGAPPPRL